MVDIQQLCCSGDERDVRENWWTKFCPCCGVEHLCLGAHEGFGVALSQGMDEARECILCEGGVASFKTRCVSNMR